MNMKNVRDYRRFGICLIFLLIVLSFSVYAAECDETLSVLPCNYTGVAPNSGLTVSCEDDCIFFNTSGVANLNGTVFYCNDTGADGCLIIRNHNIHINGQRSSLIGNLTLTSYGIFTGWTARNNINLTNFTVNNFTYPVYFYRSRNLIIRNNTFINGASNMRLTDVNESIIMYNEFINSTGVNVDFLRSYNNSFIHNLINNGSMNLVINDGCTRNSFYNNTFLDSQNTNVFFESGSSHFIFDGNIIKGSNDGGMGIRFNSSNNSIVSNNKFFDISWNGIDIDSHHCNITDNWINNSNHHGIDLAYALGDNKTSSNNIIRNNNITNMGGSVNGIYVKDSNSNTIYQNIIKDITGSCIAVEGKYTYNFANNVSENNISNCKYCIFSSSVDSLWHSNYIDSCNVSEIFISSYLGSKNIGENSSFINNEFYDGFAHYLGYSWWNVTASISESSSNYHIINYSMGATLKFEYDGLKNLSISNISSTVTCPSDSATYTIQSGEEWEIDCGSNATSLADTSENYVSNFDLYDGYYFGIINVSTNEIINYYSVFSQLLNFSVNESSTSYHEITLNSTGKIRLQYPGIKDFYVENNSLYVTSNLPSTAFLCYGFNTTCSTTSPTSVTFNLSANQFAIVQAISDSADPVVTSKANGITNLDYGYTGGVLHINCTGSGNIQLTNMNDIGAAYNVYHNGALVERTTTNDYTLTSCSDWEFTTSSQIRFETENKNDYFNAFRSGAQLLSLFVVALIAGVLYMIFTVKKNGGFEFDISQLPMALNEGMLAFLFAILCLILVIIIVVVVTGVF